MDVQCERCKTEYEFDDALVSGRGTTVKCTNCGHQFRIRRGSAPPEDERWVVRTGAGEELVYASLRELQRAIMARSVAVTDTLVRGALRRELGAIAELLPFFDAQRSPIPAEQDLERTRKVSRPPPPVPGAMPASPPSPPPRTTHPDFPPPPPVPILGTPSSGPDGAERPQRGGQALPAQRAGDTEPLVVPRMESTPPPLPPGTASTPAPGARRTASTPPPRSSPSTPPPHPTQRLPPSVPTRISAGALRPPQPVAATPPPRDAPVPPPHVRDSRPRVRPVTPAGPRGARAEVARDRPPPSAPPTAVDERRSKARSAPPPVEVHRSARMPVEMSSPLPPVSSHRARLQSSAPEPDEEPPPPPVRGVGAYVVVAVVLASLIGVGAYWAKDNLGVKAPPSTSSSSRTLEFVTAAEKALGEGSLELAKENIDKASALDEREPRVLVTLARLAAARADVAWLKLRVLPPDAVEEQRATRDAMTDLSARARKAADDAVAVAPDDPVAIRAKIDALRVSGEREAARAYVGKVIAQVGQPETAYVLAALDLAEPEPLWQTVNDRLRVAASGDRGASRARAVLVYALARSGDVAQARAELDRLKAMPTPHPLVGALRAFVEQPRAPRIAPPDAGLVAAATDDAGSVDVSTLPRSRVGAAAGGVPGDHRQILLQADAARLRGETDRARMLYSAALDRNPQDSEALNGLAEIAHAAHDLQGARNSYRRVLSINPSYLPALLGAADVEWEAGDHATAQRLYKDISDRFPDGSYPARVKQRGDQGSAAPVATGTAAPPTEKP